MIQPHLAPAAVRQIALLKREVRPLAARLERLFRALLRDRGCGALATRAFLAITPAAEARARTLVQFFEQVRYNGRRLAKLNIPPEEAHATLDAFAAIVETALEGRFAPAREQLQLATTLTLNQSYYEVRESEVQALFGLYRAEIEVKGLEDLSSRVVRILTQTLRARAGRLFLECGQDRLARPLYIERGQAEERLVLDRSMRGRYASYWSYPMGPAVVQFGFAVPYPWLPRELALLEAAARCCREAIERDHLQAEVRRLEAEARRAEEQEQHRIGRELHDEAGQSLVLLRLQLEMLESHGPPEFRMRIAGLRGQVEQIIGELRRIVSALSPAVLERLGLPAALRQLAARFRQAYPARVHVRISLPADPLPREFDEVLYRVAQESLQNIAKHSQATRVNLWLDATDKTIRLRVSDNGAGFNAERATGKPMSFGLAGMRERAMLLGGKLQIRSAPGKGTRIGLELPVPASVGAHEDSRTDH